MIGATLSLLMALSGVAPPHKTISYYIEQLGSYDRDLIAIDRYGCDAVVPLANSLRLVKAGHYPPTYQPEAVEKVVFSIAALRYITAQFRGHNT